MIGTYLSKEHSMSDVEYPLLTKEKVEEISDRISRNVSKEILQQLEKAIPALSKEETEKKKKEYNFYVGFTDRILLDFTGFVEGEVQEVTTFQRNVVVSTSCARFATADQTFDGQDIACIHIAVFFVFQEFTDFGVLFTDHLIFTVYKDLVESVDEMHEANYFFIAYGNVS